MASVHVGTAQPTMPPAERHAAPPTMQPFVPRMSFSLVSASSSGAENQEDETWLTDVD